MSKSSVKIRMRIELKQLMTNFSLFFFTEAFRKKSHRSKINTKHCFGRIKVLGASLFAYD